MGVMVVDEAVWVSCEDKGRPEVTQSLSGRGGKWN